MSLEEIMRKVIDGKAYVDTIVVHRVGGDVRLAATDAILLVWQKQAKATDFVVVE